MMRSVALFLALALSLSSVTARPYATTEERQRLRERRRYRVRRAGPSATADPGQPLLAGRYYQCPVSSATTGQLETTSLGFNNVLTCNYDEGTCTYETTGGSPTSGSPAFCPDTTAVANGGDLTYTKCPSTFNGANGSFLPDKSSAQLDTQSGLQQVQLNCVYSTPGSTTYTCVYEITNGQLEDGAGGSSTASFTDPPPSLAQLEAAGCPSSSIQATDPSQYVMSYVA